MFVLPAGVIQAKTAHHFQFHTLSSPQYELNSNTITSIVQDNEVGFIWAGTRKGLFCYNGTEYREVTTVNKSLANALRMDITKLCFDYRGWLWVGTYKGILVYDPMHDKVIEIEKAYLLKNVIVRDLFASTSGDVLIGSRNHLFTYNSRLKQIQDVTPEIRKTASDNRPYFFYSFCDGEDSTIWLSSSYGLLNFDNKHINYQDYRFFPYQETFNTNAVANQQILLKKDPNGRLLLGSDEGLYVLDIEKKTIHPYSSTINTPYNKIRALAFDHKNRLWIGTLNGILVTEDYQAPKVLSYQSAQGNSLSDDRIFTLFADKNNTMWVGTNYGGINYWSERSHLFRHTDDKGVNRLPHKIVNCIRKDKNGDLYFGTEKKGVSVYDGNSQSYRQVLDLDEQVFLGLNDVLIQDDKIWLATLSGGLVSYDKSTSGLKHFLIDKSGIQTDISFANNILCIDKELDNRLLVGTFHQGLNVFNTQTGQFKNIPLKAFKSPQRILPAVQKITQDQQGNIWCLVQDDVFRLRKDPAQPYGYEISQIYNGKVEDGWINDLCVTKVNEIWFSCPKGSVYKYANDTLRSLDLGHHVEVLTILEGEGNLLWMSTTHGIVYYNYQTQESRLFDEGLGLSKNEFSARAGAVANVGTVFFGGASGVTSFDPSEILQSKNDSLKTLITGLWVYNNELMPRDSSGVLNQPIAYAKHITLSHKQNMFTITFAPEDFSLSKHNNFEYRLVGFNDEWIKTASPKVTYTLQAGGDYLFEVRYLNAEGIASPHVSQLQVILLNPFWKTSTAYIIYFLLLAIISWWLLSLYGSKTQLKHQLEIDAVEHEKQKELNEQKLRFFTNISHDFRTPLTLIIGTIEQFVNKFPLSSEMHQMLAGAQKNSSQLMSLINDLMDFRKLENRQTNLSVSERDIVAFVQEVFLSFDNQAKIHKFNYTFHSEVDELLVYFDAPKIERVIYNLLSNAFKFTPNGGNISIGIKRREQHVEISVKDTGRGIAPEHQKHIFDRFYEVKGNSDEFIKGTGIGLTIAKNFIDLHKGELSVTSVLDEGSTFTIALPLGHDHFAPSDIVELQSDLEVLKQSQQVISPDDNRRLKAIVDDVLHQKDKKYTILIAEDDEDLGLFLKETLRDYFNVSLEPNGLKAYQSALNNPPDLIISDVLMPVMNGTEFCEKIKSNTSTCHIPFILLTARTALVYKFEGLESGADEYLSKPFQIKELLLKCANILKTQENFRQHFLNEDVRGSNENLNSKDDDYTKALKILNANIDNDAFGVNDLCEKMGLSRSVLYAKIKEWTGQSPGELLLGFRMKKAVTLLEKQKYSVAEVANKVGYKQATYFTKCFKNYYKMLPSEYVKKFYE